MVTEIIYSILDVFVRKMEASGETKHSIILDVNESMINDIYDLTGHQYSIRELEKAIESCHAHEWVENVAIENKYKSLRITTKGVGVVNSRRNSISTKNNLTIAKKISNYIEEHKGLFILLGACIALTSLYVKLFGAT